MQEHTSVAAALPELWREASFPVRSLALEVDCKNLTICSRSKRARPRFPTYAKGPAPAAKLLSKSRLQKFGGWKVGRLDGWRVGGLVRWMVGGLTGGRAGGLDGVGVGGVGGLEG